MTPQSTALRILDNAFDYLCSQLPPVSNDMSDIFQLTPAQDEALTILNDAACQVNKRS